MTNIVRGKRKGMFTFTESEHGPDVCMPYTDLKKLIDDAAWGSVLYVNMILIKDLLEYPIRDGEIEEAQRIVYESISRPIKESGVGFVDRRSDVIDVGDL